MLVIYATQLLFDAENIETEEKAFMLFINKNMLKQVAKYTNVYARKYLEANGKNPNDLTSVDFCQIKAVVRLLFLLLFIGLSTNHFFRCGHLVFLGDLYFRQLSDATGLNRSWPICNLTFKKNQSQTEKFAPFRQF